MCRQDNDSANQNIIHAHDLEYVRRSLMRALIDRSGKTKGQLQAFSENPPAEKNRVLRKPVHIVELDDGRGGTRRVAAANGAVYVSETRSRRRPLPPIDDLDYMAAPWRRAVNQLPEHDQSWLRYCYGYDLDFRHQRIICEYVWREFESDLPARIIRKTQKRLASLVWIAVQEVACMYSNTTYKEHAGALLASGLGVSRSTWCRIYSPHWQSLKEIVQGLDESSLNGALIKHITALDS